jgi:tetratricopeptide (TPR) repeat protein
VVLGAFFSGLVLAGCSSTLPSSGVRELSPEEKVVHDAHRNQAIAHFIDGSTYELRGEIAQAVLEYQEAARYDSDHAIFAALARTYSALGKHEAAIESGRQAVRLAPSSVDDRRVLATVYLEGLQPDSAVRQFEALTRLDSSALDSWYNLARLYQMRSPVKALHTLETITDRFGPQWDVLLQTADLCNKLEKFDRSAAALLKMTEIDPANTELRHSLAQTYVRARMYDSAIVTYDQLLEANPGVLDISLERAGILLVKHRYSEANREFDRVLAIDSVGIDVRLRIGEVYFGQMQDDSTLAPRTRMMFEGVRDRAPKDWRPYFFLGAIGALRHSDSTAEVNFRKVTDLDRLNADAWVYLSSVFQDRNNYAEMAKVLESAHKILPDDFRINFFLGFAYSRLNNNVEAVRVLEHARSLNPKDLDAIAQLALAYEALKNFNESDSLYEEALRLDPKNDLILNNYSYSLSERNIDLSRAMEMSKRAVDAKPGTGSYLDTYGWILYRLGRFSDALTYVKEAIAKGEANAVVFEHLGDIYFKLNDRTSALEQWNAALQMDHDNATLKEKLSRGSL